MSRIITAHHHRGRFEFPTRVSVPSTDSIDTRPPLTENMYVHCENRRLIHGKGAVSHRPSKVESNGLRTMRTLLKVIVGIS